MTLKYMQGFETMRDDSDLRAQGWIAAPSKMTMAMAPSVSGLPGTSMRFMGPGSTNTGNNGASGVPDVGFFNTGITVNQAWQAGGCAFGFYGKFNGGVATSYGSGATNNPCQTCFDGTRYWAIQLIGAAYSVAYSTDLRNWTTTTSQPPASTALSGVSTISYMGNGVVMVCTTSSSATPYVLTVYFTSNLGASWSSQTLANAGAAQGGSSGVGIATGNATYPHAILVTGNSSGANSFSGGLFVGTLGGTMTAAQVLPFSGVAGLQSTARPRLISGVLAIPFLTPGLIYFATAANASLNTAAAWTTVTLSPVINPTDIAYNPVSNLWVIAHTSGVSTIPNTGGAAGTPVAQATGTVAATSRYSTTGMAAVYWTGTQMVAVGIQGHIITSPDGITWTEAGPRILPVGTANWNWSAALFDGSQYVLFSDSNTGVIATSTDLVNNYTAQYVKEGTEQGAWVNGSGHPAICSGTAPAPGTGLWTPTANYFGFAFGPLSSGSRGVHVINTTSGTETIFTISNAGTQLGHYYELVCRSAATANNFTHELWIDGLLTYSSGATAFLMGSSTSDTTSLLILTLDRFATLTAYDDMYFNLIDGQGLSGPLGVVNVVVQRSEADTQAQWTKTGNAASNSLSVNQPALSSQSANFITSSNPGDKDIYTTTDTLPAGYTPRAVQNEAFFTKTSTTAPVVSVGSISGATESDSPTATISGSGATLVTQILEKDPNGNAAWNAASVNALKFALNHVS